MSTPAQVWSYRTLISNLAQRDLKARYKKSVLGWLWSLLNPAATLGIYTMVFGYFLGGNENAPGLGNGEGGIFSLYLFCGLVIWNMFSGTINVSIGSFQGAGALLTRTYFPPECPMVAGLATVILQGLLEASILMAFMVLLGNVAWTVLYLIPIFALLACFAFGLGLVLAVLNIRYRDVNYLMGILLQVWFYLTPIVYLTSSLGSTAQRFLQFNPLSAYVNGLRRAVYYLDGPTALNWLVMSSTAAISVVLGWLIFGRLAPKVIEEL